jgi:hypothetical protein
MASNTHTKEQVMANTLTLVDLALTPEQVYLVLGSLYETEGLFSPEDTLDAIRYIEGRMVDAELPLDMDTYQETIKSPETTTYKSINLWKVDN